MHVYPDSVPAFHLAALVRHLSTTTPVCEEVLGHHRLSAQALAMPDARLPREVMAMVLLDLMARTGRQDLGFEMGRQTDLLQHPLMGKLLSQAATLGEGMQRLAPYMPLLTPSFRMQCDIMSEADGQDMVVSWQPMRPMPYDMAKIALETVLVSAHRTARQLLPARHLPIAAQVTWSPPLHAHRYQELEDFDIHFQADQSAMGAWLRVPAQVHRLRMPRFNARLWDDTRQACMHQLQQIERMQGWRTWIEHLLQEVEDHQPSQEEIAGLMGTSVRTLARHLEAEGCTFRSLSNDMRVRRASAMLVETELSVSEIARILGYSDSANFSRAFKRATGLSPQGHRHTVA